MANHRRQVVVAWSIQYGFAFRLLGRWIVLIAIVGCCSTMAQYAACAAADAKEIALTLQTAIWSFVGAAVLLVPVLVWDALKMSHRFVGPIIRMKKAIRDIGEGRYQEIKLRKGDYWHELASELNQMQVKLKERERASVAREHHAESCERELAACGE